jgi:hypothetical protein
MYNRMQNNLSDISMKKQMFVIWLTHPLFRGAVTDPISPLIFNIQPVISMNTTKRIGNKAVMFNKIFSWCKENEKQKIPSCKAMIFPGV